jgi:hypothetical protein
VNVDLGSCNRQRRQEKAPWGAKAGITYMVLRLVEGVLGLLRLCSPLGQVKAAAAHVQRLKQKKQKKVVLEFSGIVN